MKVKVTVRDSLPIFSLSVLELKRQIIGKSTNEHVN